MAIARCWNTPYDGQQFAYVFANEWIITDFRLPSVESYMRPVVDDERADQRSIIYDHEDHSQLMQATGWLAGTERTVKSSYVGEKCRLEVDGIADFLLDFTCQQVVCETLHENVSIYTLEEMLLGPPVITMLASREIWCLHASAVEINGKVVLFLGPSGQGKSTLAAYAAHSGNPHLRRLADDLLPCTIRNEGVMALPSFPQLKLQAREQHPSFWNETFAIDAVIMLEAASFDSGICLLPVSAGRAARKLIEQTAIVSLFSRALHEKHLEFVAGLMGKVPVYTLQFPHDYDQLPDVYQSISNELEMPA